MFKKSGESFTLFPQYLVKWTPDLAEHCRCDHNIYVKYHVIFLLS